MPAPEGQSPPAYAATMRFAAVLGLAGSLAVTVAAPAVVGGDVTWWFHPRIAPAVAGNELLLYGGMASLVAAWLLLGRAVAHERVAVRSLWAIAGLWTLPLLLGPPLFSHDLYSYLAQGTLVHLGLDPYHQTPAALAVLGRSHVLSAVSPFWRHSTAPYGPLFMAVVGAIVGVTGSNLVLGSIAVRLLGVVGLGLLARYLPRLAAGRVRPALAVWLALLNPLVLLQALAPGHNDLLMVGMMVMGVALALDGRNLEGIAICALGGTIKLPALAAAVFLAVAHARARGNLADRSRALIAAGCAIAATLALVSAVSGLGLHWLSGSVFSVPAKVHLAITPSTAVAWTMASLLHASGIGVGTRGLESAVAAASAAIAVAVVIWLLRGTRAQNLVLRLGCALLVLAFAGPAAWPWYFIWGLALLAAWPLSGWILPFAAASVAGAFVVKPDGILALPLHAAPAVLCLYLGLAGGVWYAWRRTRRSELAEAAPPRTRLLNPDHVA